MSYLEPPLEKSGYEPVRKYHDHWVRGYSPYIAIHDAMIMIMQSIG